MAKRIVNKAERNAERYDAKETGYQLYEGSLKGNKFDRLAKSAFCSRCGYCWIL